MEWFACSQLFSFVLCCLVLLKLYSRTSLGRCTGYTSLLGKTAIVTGANAGIGYQVALNLASRCCKVIIADVVDSTRSREQIIRETNNENVISKHLDLTSLKSVRKFAAEIKKEEEKIDFLINNAGIGYEPRLQTDDGLPYVIQLNFLSHFLLTHLLIDLLKKSSTPKIAWASSFMAFVGGFDLDDLKTVEPSELNYTLGYNYAKSKFCMYIASNIFAKKLKSTRITSNCAHPGLVSTGLFWQNLKACKSRGTGWFTQLWSFSLAIPAFIFGKNAEEGAQSLLQIICSREYEKMTGRYVADCNPNHVLQSSIMRLKYKNLTDEFLKEFWKTCEDLVNLDEDEKIMDIDFSEQ